jgi:hypothetical protein
MPAAMASQRSFECGGGTPITRVLLRKTRLDKIGMDADFID